MFHLSCFIRSIIVSYLILCILPDMPSITPCAFVNRKMHTMLLSHCFCCPKCNFLIRIRNLGVSATTRNMAILAEYSKGIVCDKNVSPCTLSCQLVPNGKNTILKLILHTSIGYKFLDEVLWLVLYDYYRMLFLAVS